MGYDSSTLIFVHTNFKKNFKIGLILNDQFKAKTFRTWISHEVNNVRAKFKLKQRELFDKKFHIKTQFPWNLLKLKIFNSK